SCNGRILIDSSPSRKSLSVMGDAGPNAVYRLVQREMGMAIYGFKGKIKKNFYLCAGAQKAAMSGNRS
ncbi:hypothetical protein OFN54_27895, partial [Escherichia coli]|nr:hypothetical protein [Escherichia coli]